MFYFCPILMLGLLGDATLSSALSLFWLLISELGLERRFAEWPAGCLLLPLPLPPFAHYLEILWVPSEQSLIGSDPQDELMLPGDASLSLRLTLGMLVAREDAGGVFSPSCPLFPTFAVPISTQNSLKKCVCILEPWSISSRVRRKDE